jgi:hypothetical protein
LNIERSGSLLLPIVFLTHSGPSFAGRRAIRQVRCPFESYQEGKGDAPSPASRFRLAPRTGAPSAPLNYLVTRYFGDRPVVYSDVYSDPKFSIIQQLNIAEKYSSWKALDVGEQVSHILIGHTAVAYAGMSFAG